LIGNLSVHVTDDLLCLLTKARIGVIPFAPHTTVVWVNDRTAEYMGSFRALGLEFEFDRRSEAHRFLGDLDKLKGTAGKSPFVSVWVHGICMGIISLLKIIRDLCFLVDHLLFLSRLMSVFFPLSDLLWESPLFRTCPQLDLVLEHSSNHWNDSYDQR
jgi:hypothetical protein